MKSPLRSLLLVAFVVAIGISTASAVLTERAYVAALNSDSISVSVTGYEIDAEGDEPTLRVSMRIENPTRNRIVVRSAEFEVYADETLVADRPPSLGTHTVSSRGQVTTTATIPIRTGHVDRTRRAIDRGTLRVDGYVWALIEDKRIAIRLLDSGGTDG